MIIHNLYGIVDWLNFSADGTHPKCGIHFLNYSPVYMKIKYSSEYEMLFVIRESAQNIQGFACYYKRVIRKNNYNCIHKRKSHCNSANSQMLTTRSPRYRKEGLIHARAEMSFSTKIYEYSICSYFMYSLTEVVSVVLTQDCTAIISLSLFRELNDCSDDLQMHERILLSLFSSLKASSFLGLKPSVSTTKPCQVETYHF